MSRLPPPPTGGWDTHAPVRDRGRRHARLARDTVVVINGTNRGRTYRVAEESADGTLLVGAHHGQDRSHEVDRLDGQQGGAARHYHWL